MTTNSRSHPKRQGASSHRLRWVDRAAIMTLVLLLLTAFTTPSAFASSLDQGGRYNATFGSATNNLISTAAEMNSASPSSGSCVIISILLAGATNQVETGLPRCNGISVDGTCPSGQIFVETSYGSGFKCNPHGSFALGSYYSIGVARPATGNWVGQVSHVNYAGIVGGWPSSVYSRTWGEWTSTGGHTCSGWGASGIFSGWTYRSNAGSTQSFTNNNTTVAAGCWTVGTLNGGAYSVSH